MTRIGAGLAIASLLALGAAAGQPASPTSGYLTPDERPDLTRILPPPPAPGSPRARADADIFRETRALEGSPRWRLATSDVTGDMLDHFACAIGARLKTRKLPALDRLMTRAGEDRAAVGVAKTRYATRRPYLDMPGAICEPKTAHLAGNGDYPSGHAAHGQHVAMILAALAPARATPLLARGREFGESRFICGSHSRSAAEAGLLAGAAIFAAEQGQADFRRDMEAARIELTAALAKAPPMSGCG